MKYFCLLLFFFSASLEAKVVQSSFSSNKYEHTYYLETPSKSFFPIIVAIEGSFDKKKGPRSIIGLHHVLSTPLLEAGFALVTLERRGVKGIEVDETLFHQFNLPSQRLADHVGFVEHLKENPPPGWDGRLIILGGSEGGPVAIKLSHKIAPDGCIILAGCQDEPFKELIWDFVQFSKMSDLKNGQYLPATREEFDWQCERMKLDPDPTKWWLGQTYLYWSEALDQTEAEEFLGLRCPVMVVAGSKDLKTESTDRLVEKGLSQGQEVNYLRVEGMGHQVLDPQWKILDSIIDYLNSILTQTVAP